MPRRVFLVVAAMAVVTAVVLLVAGLAVRPSGSVPSDAERAANGTSVPDTETSARSANLALAWNFYAGINTLLESGDATSLEDVVAQNMTCLSTESSPSESANSTGSGTGSNLVPPYRADVPAALLPPAWSPPEPRRAPSRSCCW